MLVGEVGLEPTKAKPADLQSAPFAARDTPPDRAAYLRHDKGRGKCELCRFRSHFEDFSRATRKRPFTSVNSGVDCARHALLLGLLRGDLH